jgi:hypothetical protein
MGFCNVNCIFAFTHMLQVELLSYGNFYSTVIIKTILDTQTFYLNKGSVLHNPKQDQG